MIWLFAALANPAVELAPSIGELRQALDLLDDQLSHADAFAEAVGRVHNGWAEQVGPPDRRVPCDHDAASLAARSAWFGEGWRDAAQLARTTLDRANARGQRPTVSPLLDDTDRQRLDTLSQRVWTHNAQVLEASAWHDRHLASFLQRCTPELSASDGLVRHETLASGETWGATAVGLLDEGPLCTNAGPTKGPALVVLTEPLACVAQGCDCEPSPVLPGAVLSASSDPRSP